MAKSRMTCCKVPINWIVENFLKWRIEWMKSKRKWNWNSRTWSQSVWCSMIAFLWSHSFQFDTSKSSNSLIMEWLIERTIASQNHIVLCVWFAMSHANFIEMFQIRNNLNLVAWISFDCEPPRCMHLVLIMQMANECGYFIWIAYIVRLHTYWSSVQLRGDCCCFRCYNLFVCFRLNSKAIIIWQRNRIGHTKNYACP